MPLPQFLAGVRSGSQNQGTVIVPKPQTLWISTVFFPLILFLLKDPSPGTILHFVVRLLWSVIILICHSFINDLDSPEEYWLRTL